MADITQVLLNTQRGSSPSEMDLQRMPQDPGFCPPGVFMCKLQQLEILSWSPKWKTLHKRDPLTNPAQGRQSSYLPVFPLLQFAPERNPIFLQEWHFQQEYSLLAVAGC